MDLLGLPEKMRSFTFSAIPSLAFSLRWVPLDRADYACQAHNSNHCLKSPKVLLRADTAGKFHQTDYGSGHQQND